MPRGSGVALRAGALRHDAAEGRGGQLKVTAAGVVGCGGGGAVRRGRGGDRRGAVGGRARWGVGELGGGWVLKRDGCEGVFDVFTRQDGKSDLAYLQGGGKYP